MSKAGFAAYLVIILQAWNYHPTTRVQKISYLTILFRIEDMRSDWQLCFIVAPLYSIRISLEASP